MNSHTWVTRVHRTVCFQEQLPGNTKNSKYRLGFDGTGSNWFHLKSWNAGSDSITEGGRYIQRKVDPGGWTGYFWTTSHITPPQTHQKNQCPTTSYTCGVGGDPQGSKSSSEDPLPLHHSSYFFLYQPMNFISTPPPFPVITKPRVGVFFLWEWQDPSRETITQRMINLGWLFNRSAWGPRERSAKDTILLHDIPTPHWSWHY